MRLRCTSCCKMDDGIRVSADAPFWWTSLPQLHTFTLSSADALWLKGVREGALAVARTPWSDAAGRRTAQLGESQNYFVTMGIQNPDNSCTACTDYSMARPGAWRTACRLGTPVLWRRQTFDPRIERCAPAVPQHDRARTSAIPLPAHRPCAAASQQSPAAIVPHGDVGCLVGFRQEGSPPSTPYMRCLIKREDTFASVVRRYMISANLDEAPGDKLKCPISSHRSSFQSASSRMSAGSTSTLPFAAQVRSSLETHLEPFTSCCSFAASLAPPHPCSRRANLTIRTCFLAQGWRSTSTPSILITRSSCLALQVRPRSDLDGLGAAVVSAAGWCSRAASSRAMSSPPPTTITGSLGSSIS